MSEKDRFDEIAYVLKYRIYSPNSARIRLSRIDEPRTDSREGVPKNTECKIAMIVFVDICGNLPFPASGRPSARIRLCRIDEPITNP